MCVCKESGREARRLKDRKYCDRRESKVPIVTTGAAWRRPRLNSWLCDTGPTLLLLEASFPSLSVGLVPPSQGFCEAGRACLASGCSKILFT